MYQIIVIPILLACIGATIALAKILLTEDPLKPRIVVGRCILGAATSALAGGVLHFVPNLSTPAVVAIGCALGLLGHVYIEENLKRYSSNWIKEKKESFDD